MCDCVWLGVCVIVCRCGCAFVFMCACVIVCALCVVYFNFILLLFFACACECIYSNFLIAPRFTISKVSADKKVRSVRVEHEPGSGKQNLKQISDHLWTCDAIIYGLGGKMCVQKNSWVHSCFFGYVLRTSLAPVLLTRVCLWSVKWVCEHVWGGVWTCVRECVEVKIGM